MSVLKANKKRLSGRPVTPRPVAHLTYGPRRKATRIFLKRTALLLRAWSWVRAHAGRCANPAARRIPPALSSCACDVQRYVQTETRRDCESVPHRTRNSSSWHRLDSGNAVTRSLPQQLPCRLQPRLGRSHPTLRFAGGSCRPRQPARRPPRAPHAPAKDSQRPLAVRKRPTKSIGTDPFATKRTAGQSTRRLHLAVTTGHNSGAPAPQGPPDLGPGQAVPTPNPHPRRASAVGTASHPLPPTVGTASAPSPAPRRRAGGLTSV